MKKILKTLLMLTCVLGLTACGSEETISDHQQKKINEAQNRSEVIVSFVEGLVESGTGAEWSENYDNMEIADMFSGSLANNLYQQTGQYYTFEAEGKGIRGAISSFESGLEEIGSVTGYGQPTAVVDDDTIIVTIPVTCENGTGSIELIFSNDIYFVMSSCTFNLNESMGELMVRAALNTLIGMGTVFVVLILISAIIGCFSFIPKIQAKFAKKEDAPVAAPVQAPVVEEEELADDMELVAVIAAAIAAYEGTSADGFQVRSIKRANTKKWQRS